jgi:hypothetical protein
MEYRARVESSQVSECLFLCLVASFLAVTLSTMWLTLSTCAVVAFLLLTNRSTQAAHVSRSPIICHIIA